MLKIAGYELSYWKPVLLWIVGIYFLTILIAALRLNNDLFTLYGIIAAMCSFLLVVFFILNIFVTLYEMREKRLRLLAVLPVTTWEIALARILTPILFTLIFFLLSLVFFNAEAYLSAYNNPAATTEFDLSTHSKVITYFLIYSVPIWFLLIYPIRLFMEPWGRVLFGLVFLPYFVLYVILPIFNNSLAMNINKLINERFQSIEVFNLVVLMLLALMWIVLFTSLVKRKSFISL